MFNKDQEDLPMNEVDKKYLSRFEVTQTCTSNNPTEPAVVTKSTEWIEPLTMHARHPFAYAWCNIGRYRIHDPPSEYNARRAAI